MTPTKGIPRIADNYPGAWLFCYCCGTWYWSDMDGTLEHICIYADVLTKDKERTWNSRLCTGIRSAVKAVLSWFV